VHRARVGKLIQNYPYSFVLSIASPPHRFQMSKSSLWSIRAIRTTGSLLNRQKHATAAETRRKHSQKPFNFFCCGQCIDHLFYHRPRASILLPRLQSLNPTTTPVAPQFSNYLPPRPQNHDSSTTTDSPTIIHSPTTPTEPQFLTTRRLSRQKNQVAS
jgi:hypothetical protein